MLSTTLDQFLLPLFTLHVPPSGPTQKCFFTPLSSHLLLCSREKPISLGVDNCENKHSCIPSIPQHVATEAITEAADWDAAVETGGAGLAKRSCDFPLEKKFSMETDPH